MRPRTLFLLTLGLTATAKASWFGSDSSVTDDASGWTQEQYARAQAVFSGLKSDAFDSWDESRLREFLLEQGVVQPSGTREQLALLAKQRYGQWSKAASEYSASATSLASQASQSASTAVYGDSQYQASKSLSSVIAQATTEAARKLDDSKDYVYSTWDDNRLRSYLEEKGVIKTKQQATRDEMLAKMKETYTKSVNPVWQAWSDSYIREWLVGHGIIKTETQKQRDQLTADMNKYYYDTKDSVYSTWSDSQMKDWLVEHNVIKSDAQIQREKLQKLIADNYVNAKDTVWGSWRDSDMRDWLIEHGYLKNDAQKTREQLVTLMHEKYNDNAARTAAYLTWPDARLRAYLREHNISEEALPTSRPGLLQEVRIRYVQASSRAEALYVKIRDALKDGVEVAEEAIGDVLEKLTGHAESAKSRAAESYEQGKGYANHKYADSQEYVNEKFDQAADYASDKTKSAKGTATSAAHDAKGQAEKVKADAKKKTAEYGNAGAKYWNEKVEDAKRSADKAKVEL
ncbi:hypothetical protein EUX98_g4221 [Antrodiella citrinella]|uniref:Uncharacterized protein n=1 Tax=Antrodiella citrinella TaxID=2447956 RepID=A0A4S4MVK5_9APHY|nr:hypothetical protein EUX98_g4221 [Antrodiella citrinella]